MKPSSLAKNGPPLDTLNDAQQRWLLASFDDPSRLTLSLPEQIANKLAEEIITGVYSPGQRLQEIALAQQFSVSRGPIRDALRIIEREGLVVIQPRRGASVATMTPQDLADIFEVRALLMGLATRRMAERPSKKVADFLAAAEAALLEAIDDPQHFLALAYRASMYVAEAAGNELGRAILFSLGRKTLSVTRVVLLERANRAVWLDNLSASAAAIAAKQPAKAEAAMRKLVDMVGAAAVQVLVSQLEASHWRGANA
jgi:DNA-binding GntR family transcriptional regulator